MKFNFQTKLLLEWGREALVFFFFLLISSNFDRPLQPKVQTSEDIGQEPWNISDCSSIVWEKFPLIDKVVQPEWNETVLLSRQNVWQQTFSTGKRRQATNTFTRAQVFRQVKSSEWLLKPVATCLNLGLKKNIFEMLKSSNGNQKKISALYARALWLLFHL